MKIQVNVRSVYGNELVYPVCNLAKEFCKLLGTKTIPWHAIASIKALGFTVERVQESGVL